jgi:hypothetical protein
MTDGYNPTERSRCKTVNYSKPAMRHAVSEADGSDDDRDWNSADDEEAMENERSEALNKRFAAMDDDQRTRFELFRSRNCKIPPKWCTETLQRVLPSGTTVQGGAGLVASFAVKLFVADLIETAKRLSNGSRPLTPDLIIVAYNEMESRGKIPGKGTGVKRHQLR